MSSHTEAIESDPMLRDPAWHARLACVLSGALRLWNVAGTVQRDEDGFVIAVSGSGLELAHADAAIQDLTPLRIAPRTPHGWLIVRGAETLGVHAGLPGLLRQLREELAPHARAGRLIIGVQSLL
jgi:hypothetical protein